jgi:hypothetical protein
MGSPEIVLQQFEALANQMRQLLRARDQLVTEERELTDRRSRVDRAIAQVEKAQLLDGAAFGELIGSLSRRRSRMADEPTTTTGVVQKRDRLKRSAVIARQEARRGAAVAFLGRVAAATIDEIVDGTGAKAIMRGFAAKYVQNDVDTLVELGQCVALGDGRYALRR